MMEIFPKEFEKDLGNMFSEIYLRPGFDYRINTEIWYQFQELWYWYQANTFFDTLYEKHYNKESQSSWVKYYLNTSILNKNALNLQTCNLNQELFDQRISKHDHESDYTFNSSFWHLMVNDE